ncbi:MAG: DeoR/GlpR family DNA-binding transcription regulator [Alphaproteobacteria bacterium]
MLTERQKDILRRAANSDRVEVEELSAHYDVSPQTIRKDLNDLCERGLLTRVHGGARAPNSVSNTTYQHRRESYAEEKTRIGQAAAACIPNNSSVIINIGTTTEMVARALYDHTDLIVITNNINVVTILSGSPSKELILAGGVVRQSDGGIVGEATMEFIRQFRADFAVIGASAVDENGIILDFDMREVSVARTIIESARKVVLVIDSSKFERRSTVRICDVSAIDYVVCDSEPPARFRQACLENDCEIIVAEELQDLSVQHEGIARVR